MISFRRLCFPVLLLMISGTIAAGADPQNLADGVRGLEERLAARVGQGGVGEQELRFYLDDYARGKGTVVSKLEAVERREVLEKAVGDEMIFQEAVKEGLHREPLFYGKIVEHYRSQAVVQDIRPRDFREEDILRMYEANPEEFVHPARFRFQMLVLPRGSGDGEALAEKARANPENVSGWMDSGWTDAEKGLRLPFEPGEEEKIFSMKTGDVYGPVEDRMGLQYIFRMTDYEPPREKTLKEAKPQIVHRLIVEKQKVNEQKLDEEFSGEDARERLFVHALDEGYHRWQMNRRALINSYLELHGGDRAKVLEELRGKYPVEILRETP